MDELTYGNQDSLFFHPQLLPQPLLFPRIQQGFVDAVLLLDRGKWVVKNPLLSCSVVEQIFVGNRAAAVPFICGGNDKRLDFSPKGLLRSKQAAVDLDAVRAAVSFQPAHGIQHGRIDVAPENNLVPGLFQLLPDLRIKLFPTGQTNWVLAKNRPKVLILLPEPTALSSVVFVRAHQKHHCQRDSVFSSQLVEEINAIRGRYIDDKE